MSAVLDEAAGSGSSSPARGRAEDPPGPSLLELPLVLMSVLRDPYHGLQGILRRYGDVTRINIPGFPLTLINHPDHVAHVFSKHADRYDKGDMNRAMTKGVAESGQRLGLPLSDGDEWRTMRRLINPMFGQKRLNELSTLMGDAIVERVDTWEQWAGTGEVIDLDPELSGVTMSVLLRSMFSSAVDDDDVDQAVQDFRLMGHTAAWKMLTAWAPSWVPVPYAGRFDAAGVRIKAFIDRLVAERRAHPVESPDLLGMFLEARYDDGEPLSDDDLRAELVGMLFGGFETTASALVWTLALLDRHPDVAETVYDEIDALGGRPVTVTDLPTLKYTKACFDEAQRLQGGVFFSRSPIEEDQIGGYRIPKGSIVAVSPFALHRDPRFFPDPDRFDPSRFLNGSIDKFAFIPFGAGPRHCVASNMAYIEAQFTLATIFQRYRVRCAPGFVPRHQFHASTGTKGGLPVTVHHRRAGSMPPGAG